MTSENGGERYSSRSRSPARPSSRQRREEGMSRSRSPSPREEADPAAGNREKDREREKDKEKAENDAATPAPPSSSPVRRRTRSRSRSYERYERRERGGSGGPPGATNGSDPGLRRSNYGSSGRAGFGRRPPPPPPPSQYSAPMTRITTSVKDRLRELYDSDIIREGDLDVRALEDLSLLNEDEGLIALDELSKVDLSRIRNLSAFFVGICKRTVRKGASRYSRGPSELAAMRAGAGDYGSYYDTYPYQDYRRGAPQSFRSDISSYPPRDSYYGSQYDAPAASVYQRMDYHILQEKQRDRGRDRVFSKSYDYRDDTRWRDRERIDHRDSRSGRDRFEEYDHYRSSTAQYRAPATYSYEDMRQPRSSRAAPPEGNHHHSSYYDERAAYDSPPRYHR
eukprot:TRINITY_DN8225_c2_g1_i1.p2 TRINITY_DN8225_c2_g1~~TRINITY_DN8225_c2_g1_i1.p2  ORF type:complete len:395 (+),score=33.13 TRINITY_DN8225_c2_g1_i1:65-1249(+)